MFYLQALPDTTDKSQSSNWSESIDKDSFAPVDPSVKLASSYNWLASNDPDSDQFFTSITSSAKVGNQVRAHFCHSRIK